MELLLTYEDEGIYIDIYGHFTKETVLQWGEMPASVGRYEKQHLPKYKILLREAWLLYKVCIFMKRGCMAHKATPEQTRCVNRFMYVWVKAASDCSRVLTEFVFLSHRLLRHSLTPQPNFTGDAAYHQFSQTELYELQREKRCLFPTWIIHSS